MACSSPANAFTNNLSFASNNPYSVGRRPTSSIVPGKPLMVWSCDTRDSYGSLAARLLGPPTSFEASKLKVVFMGEQMDKQPLGISTRAYTLTHCDFTANLTLAVSNSISSDKVLKAVVHGDSVLFSKHPELMEAKVWVYFHSKSKRYNRVECWGPLKNATQRTYNIRSVDFRTAVAAKTKKWANPEQVLHAIVAFLL
ncbi:protein STAY-GREEN LIKE, chloroplastic isoform X3 [Elaeis guineensis]|uniref:protein STAY-GREEN LIKE, chloroplastic isoform X3 n=1 Tax=Elaeis guineensis var. tenera TaxID=51953 RepID=UPI003C6CE1D0